MRKVWNGVKRVGGAALFVAMLPLIMVVAILALPFTLGMDDDTLWDDCDGD